MTDHAPAQPENSYRVKLTLNFKQPRLDALLIEALRGQDDNQELKRISRTAFKALFNEKRIVIKGQAAKPSSALAAGVTYVDVLGYAQSDEA